MDNSIKVHIPPDEDVALHVKVKAASIKHMTGAVAGTHCICIPNDDDGCHITALQMQFAHALVKKSCKR